MCKSWLTAADTTQVTYENVSVGSARACDTDSDSKGPTCPKENVYMSMAGLGSSGASDATAACTAVQDNSSGSLAASDIHAVMSASPSEPAASGENPYLLMSGTEATRSSDNILYMNLGQLTRMSDA